MILCSDKFLEIYEKKKEKKKEKSFIKLKIFCSVKDKRQ